MSLDDLHTIDALGTENITGKLVLNIIDGWDWTDERNHLVALQSKLNSYFAFIESGQLGEMEPSWADLGAKIEVVFRYPPPDSAVALLKTAEFVAQPLNLAVSHSVRSAR